jgi:UTP--glucose-1-phosphate uridylyltransferase
VTIRKAVITAAARGEQRALPLQRLIGKNGGPTTALGIIVGEAVQAGIEEICVVVAPGDEKVYAEAAGAHVPRISFAIQSAPLGYGHALYCARDFTQGESFLHMVGDHIYVTEEGDGSFAQQIVALAEAQGCSVSGVKATRENELPLFGAIGGMRVPNTNDTYVVEEVREKPTPTEAEQFLSVPGLRAGYYLCFFGMHVFGPAVMELLAGHVERHLSAVSEQRIELSPVLSALAQRERYLALEVPGFRCPIDVPYGLFTAQLALSLSGKDRDNVLGIICDHLSRRAMSSDGGGLHVK